MDACPSQSWGAASLITIVVCLQIALVGLIEQCISFRAFTIMAIVFARRV